MTAYIKKIGFFLILSSLCSCTEMSVQDIPVEDGLFYASIQDITKTYLDDEAVMYWNSGDCISVFNSYTNEKYAFTGETGEIQGKFKKVENIEPSGQQFSHNYAIYPYSESNFCTAYGEFDVSLPSEQHYVKDSFGIEENLMVAITSSPSDHLLRFKNLCGYLQLKIYGGLPIKSIKLYGNNNEEIAGDAHLVVNDEPLIKMKDECATEVELYCGEEGVRTSLEKSSSTTFLIILPPTEFEKGLTVEINCVDGSNVVKSTEKNISICRNVIQPMSPIEIVGTNVEEISLNKKKLSLYKGEKFQLEATVLPEDATIKEVTFSSSNTKTAQVSPEGLVTACDLGTSIITIQSVDGYCSTHCYVAVNDGNLKFQYTGGKRASTIFSLAEDDAAYSISVYYYIPTGDISNKTVQISMHGMNRNVEDYVRYWQTKADQYDLVILGPGFDLEQYPVSKYQQGGVVDDKGQFVPPEKMTYHIIEEMFDFFLAHSDSKAETYNIWGHSAGGQFCHRFSTFANAPRAKRIVAANPGTYTFPDVSLNYPYGWSDCESKIGINRENFYSKDFTLMLGMKDLQRTSSLPQSPMDDAQGKNRYERGKNYFNYCKEDAEQRGLQFNWIKVEVPDVAHNGDKMAVAAADYLYGN